MNEHKYFHHESIYGNELLQNEPIAITIAIADFEDENIRLAPAPKGAMFYSTGDNLRPLQKLAAVRNKATEQKDGMIWGTRRLSLWRMA